MKKGVIISITIIALILIVSVILIQNLNKKGEINNSPIKNQETNPKINLSDCESYPIDNIIYYNTNSNESCESSCQRSSKICINATSVTGRLNSVSETIIDCKDYFRNYDSVFVCTCCSAE